MIDTCKKLNRNRDMSLLTKPVKAGCIITKNKIISTANVQLLELKGKYKIHCKIGQNRAVEDCKVA
jgi:hypothetical protein